MPPPDCGLKTAENYTTSGWCCKGKNGRVAGIFCDE